MEEILTEQVCLHSLLRVSVELHQMQSTLEAVAKNQELILGLTQAQVLEMQRAFLPITLEGDQSPDVSEEGHLSDEGEGDGEPFFQDDKEL